MKIAYIVGRYPSVTHTFIQREIQALRILGVSIDTVSIHRPREQDTLSAAARDEARHTHAILPLSPLAPSLVTLMALALRPRQYLRALRSPSVSPVPESRDISGTSSTSPRLF